MTAPYTLSGSHRAHICPPSCSGIHAEEETEGQSVGSARHAFIAKVAQLLSGAHEGWQISMAAAAALDHVAPEHRAECEALDMDALAPFLAPGEWAHNVSVAWRPESGGARIIGLGLSLEDRDAILKKGPDAEMYARGEIVTGEADVVGLTADAVVVLDFKPPWGQAEHFEAWKAQVEGYAAPLAAAYGKSSAVCAVLQLRPGAKPVSWTLDSIELDAVRLKHARTLEVIRAGDAPFKIGQHCTYCPRLRTCPAQTAMIKAAAEGMAGEIRAAGGSGGQDIQARAAVAAKFIEGPATDAEVTAAHEWIKTVKAAFKIVSDAIETRALAHPVDCGDGTVLGFREVLDREGGVDPDAAFGVLREMGFPVDRAAGVGLRTVPEKSVANRKTIEASVKASGQKPIVKIVAKVMEEIEARGGLSKHPELKRFKREER